MAKILAASCAAVVSAASAHLKWTDCGDADTFITIVGLDPEDVPVPGKTTLTGSGFLSADEEGGQFKFSAKAAGVQVLSGGGDLCEENTITLPDNAGEIVFHAVDCPAAAGQVDVKLDLNLLDSAAWTNDLVDIQISALSTSGDKLMCMAIQTNGVSEGTSDIGLQAEMELQKVCMSSDQCPDGYGCICSGKTCNCRRRDVAVEVQRSCADGSGPCPDGYACICSGHQCNCRKMTSGLELQKSCAGDEQCPDGYGCICTNYGCTCQRWPPSAVSEGATAQSLDVELQQVCMGDDQCPDGYGCLCRGKTCNCRRLGMEVQKTCMGDDQCPDGYGCLCRGKTCNCRPRDVALEVQQGCAVSGCPDGYDCICSGHQCNCRRHFGMELV